MKPLTAGAGCVSGQPITPTLAPRSLRMLQIGRASRSLGGLRLLAEEPERDERLRKAVVGQQLDRRAAERPVDHRRTHAVVHRIASGGDRAPHRFGLGWPQRRQVQHGALVENAADVRQAARGDGGKDHLERRAIKHQQPHVPAGNGRRAFVSRWNRSRHRAVAARARER